MQLRSLLPTAIFAGTIAFGFQAATQIPVAPLRLAIIGDSGTGSTEATQIGDQLSKIHQTNPFSLALMLGDNMYGGESPRDFEKKFERPYKPLLGSGVKFYASIGNHDDVKQIGYPGFNMNGRRYYTFRPDPRVQFFALDSTKMDEAQLAWIDKELAASDAPWKVCFFHHPIYSSGKRHGPSLVLRSRLEPLFVKHNVSVVLAGHEHFYERIKPQNGIYYFIAGSSAKLRKNGLNKTSITEKGYAEDRAFLTLEFSGDKMNFRAINRTGTEIDSGTITRPSPQRP